MTNETNELFSIAICHAQWLESASKIQLRDELYSHKSGTYVRTPTLTALFKNMNAKRVINT
jgi:hypothetical protein